MIALTKIAPGKIPADPDEYVYIHANETCSSDESTHISVAERIYMLPLRIKSIGAYHTDRLRSTYSQKNEPFHNDR